MEKFWIMAHKIRMVMEIAMKELIKWMKSWLDVLIYVSSKASECKLEKAEVTPSRGKGERGKDRFDSSCFWFIEQRRLKIFANGAFFLFIYTYSAESMFVMLGKMLVFCLS